MTQQNNIGLKFDKLKFGSIDKHINKMPFSGCCMFVNKPSDGVPCGSDKPVMFSKESVDEAISTFIGMGVDVVYDDWNSPCYALTGHNSRYKIGVIESAEVRANKVYVKGFLWASDFYDVCFMIKNAKDSLGFSIEVYVTDMVDSGESYMVNHFTYTGLAILYKNLAAFKDTQLAAKRQEKGVKMEDDKKMDEKEMKALTESFKAAVTEVFQPINDTVVELSNKVKELEKKELKVEAPKIDFSVLDEKFKALDEKIAGLTPKAEEKEEVKVEAARKTKVTPAAKEEEKEHKVSLSEQIAEIDKNTLLNEQERMNKKMALWAASRKAD